MGVGLAWPTAEVEAVSVEISRLADAKARGSGGGIVWLSMYVCGFVYKARGGIVCMYVFVCLCLVSCLSIYYGFVNVWAGRRASPVVSFLSMSWGLLLFSPLL
jgi:hypothetical protein